MSGETRGRKQRLFYALWPDAAARKALVRLAEEIARDGQGRAPRDVNLHLTVAFVGEVPVESVEALSTIGAHAAGSVAPFRIVLERLGGTSYGVAWLAPAAAVEPLHALHLELRSQLVAAGHALEQRMFRPHITLARDRIRSVQRGSVPSIGWTVEALSLVASTPAPGGSDYRPVAEWRLGRSR
ncbi:MAG TPA: RNA 2',3'-cyclic phosphodiesterase [Casimicrobiaceae bacterium]|nr:RNA 2',3'-cyclic phosphodiesterase [Casimicrobiaceae bacterium]